MALLVLSAAAAAARRVSQSFKFNTLIRHRFLSHRRSRTGQILFVVMSPEKEHLYSAEIQKGGTLGPATRLPPIPFESICYDLRSFQVCNGLICLRVGGKFHIFSPYKGEVFPLPDDPCIHFYPVFYFGFHPLSNEYKVLFFGCRRESGFWIFSSSSLSWRQIHPLTPERFDNESFCSFFSYRQHIFLNGLIHSIYEAYPDPDYIYTGRPPVLPEIYVSAFDMAEEKFRKIPYPDFSSSSFVPKLNLTEFGGCLALIKDYFYCPGKLRKYDVFECWILEDYGNHEWVKRTFHLPFEWMRYHHFLAFNNNTGEMLLESADVRRDTRNSKCLLYYNTNTGIFRRPELTEITPSWSRFSVDITFDN